MSVSLSLLRHRSFTGIFTHRISFTQKRRRTLHASLLDASPPCFMHADAAPSHLPPSRRRSSIASSAAASPPSWITQVQRRPASLKLLLAACLPSAPSLPLAAAPSDPPQMTQAAPDLVEMSDFLCFWLGVGDALLPASASTTRRRLKNHGGGYMERVA
jgi:hypothetical protein